MAKSLEVMEEAIFRLLHLLDESEILLLDVDFSSLWYKERVPFGVIEALVSCWAEDASSTLVAFKGLMVYDRTLDFETGVLNRLALSSPVSSATDFPALCPGLLLSALLLDGTGVLDV